VGTDGEFNPAFAPRLKSRETYGGAGSLDDLTLGRVAVSDDEELANLISGVRRECGGILEFSPTKAGLDVTPANLEFDGCQQLGSPKKGKQDGLLHIAGTSMILV